MKRQLFSIIAATLCFGGVAYASGGAHWSYSGEAGPGHWGELSHDYAACKEGRSQSPIDLTGMVDIDLPAIDFSYGGTALEVLNNGHAIQANYAAGSSITVDGKTYELLQFHFHSPSENTINGHSFPLEAHLVHKNAEGQLAVIAVMFETGAANPAVGKVWEKMPAVAGETQSLPAGSVSALEILPEERSYYAFDGSLTTPPCTEGVKWMVLKQPMSITDEQLKAFQATMHGPNNRPVQPLHGRKISE